MTDRYVQAADIGNGYERWQHQILVAANGRTDLPTRVALESAGLAPEVGGAVVESTMRGLGQNPAEGTVEHLVALRWGVTMLALGIAIGRAAAERHHANGDD